MLNFADPALVACQEVVVVLKFADLASLCIELELDLTAVAFLDTVVVAEKDLKSAADQGIDSASLEVLPGPEQAVVVVAAVALLD